MIDTELHGRYVRAFGETFTVSRWERRPGDAVNEMMRRALTASGPAVTDEHIAIELANRLQRSAIPR